MKIPFNFFELFIFLYIQLIFTGGFIMPQERDTNTAKAANIEITIIYDNYPFLKNLETDWGFSCLVEIGKISLLFDTGDKGDVLLNNMKKLGIAPKDVDFVFLSHFHHDHTGGLISFLKKNSKVTIYYPQSFPAQLIEEMQNSGAKLVRVSAFKELQTNIYSLGELYGIIPEQSLAVRTSKGIVIITGCAHPGIINILEKAKELFPDEKIYLVIGGFHLIRKPENELNDIINKIFKMGILNAAPSHCSGSSARKMFGEIFKSYYIETGTGKNIRVE
jgi:7,8-dihydropterin-6-yl-methyl-4-(beta-D-ribofuranosyl)aminobenzene 5'-phosphate synthase